MKRIMVVLVFSLLLIQLDADAQCSICTKTAQQLGHKPAKGLNTGIIYLMFAPFAIMGWVGYNYFKSKRPE
jgi:hypothetical protein